MMNINRASVIKSKMIYMLTFILFTVLWKCTFAQTIPPVQYYRPLFDFTERKPTLILTAGQRQSKTIVSRYFLFSGHREGVPATRSAFNLTFKALNDSITATRQLYMYNLTIPEMVSHFADFESQIFLEVKDSSKYIYNALMGSKEEWLRKNTYCFEVIFPLGTISNIAIVDAILKSYLGIEFGWQIRRVPVLVLKKINDNTTVNNSEAAMQPDSHYRRFDHLSLGGSVKRLNEYFIDETRSAGNIDLDIKTKDISNLERLNKELKKYNLIFTRDIRDQKLFVIQEVTDPKI
jgi:hypothetical protein